MLSLFSLSFFSSLAFERERERESGGIQKTNAFSLPNNNDSMSTSSRPPTAVTISVAGCVWSPIRAKKNKKKKTHGPPKENDRPLFFSRRRRRRRHLFFLSSSYALLSPSQILSHTHRRYRLGRKIGSGSFGDIYLGTLTTKSSSFCRRRRQTTAKQTKKNSIVVVFLFFFFFSIPPPCLFSCRLLWAWCFHSKQCACRVSRDLVRTPTLVRDERHAAVLVKRSLATRCFYFVFLFVLRRGVSKKSSSSSAALSDFLLLFFIAHFFFSLSSLATRHNKQGRTCKRARRSASSWYVFLKRKEIGSEKPRNAHRRRRRRRQLRSLRFDIVFFFFRLSSVSVQSVFFFSPLILSLFHFRIRTP